MAFANLFLALVAGHALMDYPLQSDFLARGKNHKAPIPGIPWVYCLGSHAILHGAAVAYLTGSTLLGILETLIHTVIDYGKCDGRFGMHTDQALHIACKVVWAIVAVACLAA